MSHLKLLFLFLIILKIPSARAYSQTIWQSSNYNYSIEVPQGFTETTPIGQNVDFKAEKGSSSIVLVVKVLPAEYAQYTIWEIMGDLTTYGYDWENGAREYMNNPQFLKYGKTKVDGQDAFWYDYTTDSPKLYSKVYQTQNGRFIYTFTLTSPSEDYNYYSSVWFKLKNSIKL